MKIASSQQTLSSSHLELEHREVSERLRAWTGERPGRADEARSRQPEAVRGPNENSAPARLSALARALSMTPPAPAVPQPPTGTAVESPEASAISSAIENADNDPMLILLRTMLEKMFGIHLKLFDPDEMETDTSAAEGLTAPVAATGNASNGGSVGWGIEYEYHEQRTEIETTRFAAEGIVRTADGKEISFQLELEMSRSYSERIDVSFRAGDAARKKDPLVVNFGGSAAQLSDQRFEIDLDGDGRKESARFAAQGSGFLVFDRNADGRINDGKEMFGPATGDGFAELAALDGDNNGWIDESDAVYAQLRVWTKNPDGSDVLRTLKDANVGAISLARLATPFSVKDSSNALLGEVRSTGVYLSDDGKVGTVQQIDLAV